MAGKLFVKLPLFPCMQSINIFGRGENKDIVWEDLFDVVIVGACKPAFLKENHLSIFKVDK